MPKTFSALSKANMDQGHCVLLPTTVSICLRMSERKKKEGEREKRESDREKKDREKERQRKERDREKRE
jgi:hypothetical protein